MILSMRMALYVQKSISLKNILSSFTSPPSRIIFIYSHWCCKIYIETMYFCNCKNIVGDLRSRVKDPTSVNSEERILLNKGPAHTTWGAFLKVKIRRANGPKRTISHTNLQTIDSSINIMVLSMNFRASRISW